MSSLLRESMRRCSEEEESATGSQDMFLAADVEPNKFCALVHSNVVQKW